MCPTNSTTTTMLASTTTTTTTREKEEGGVRKGEDEKVRKGGGEKLLDKDWGARIPDYISRSLLSLLVFIMGLTMKVFFFNISFLILSKVISPEQIHVHLVLHCKYLSSFAISPITLTMVSVMKGDWLLVLALRERASKESVVEEEVAEQGDLAVWLQQRFNGYFTVLVKNHLLNF